MALSSIHEGANHGSENNSTTSGTGGDTEPTNNGCNLDERDGETDKV